jgi:hypothetical protein
MQLPFRIFICTNPILTMHPPKDDNWSVCMQEK